MTADPVSSSNPPTRLAFALGSLTERINHTVEAQERLQATADNMPERVVALLHPRLLLIEAKQSSHDGRLQALERDKWKVIGGGVVILAIAGIVIGHPIK